MSRQLYETDSDISKEQSVALACAKAWGSSCRKLPKLHGMDFAFIRDEFVCSLAEIKCRTCNHNTYETYMISLNKLITAKQVSQYAGIPCLLIVKWKDRTGYINFNEPFNYLKMGGRADRNDPYDIEPMAHWSIDKFTFIKVMS